MPRKTLPKNKFNSASKPPICNPRTFSGKPRFNKPPPTYTDYNTGTDSESDTNGSNSGSDSEYKLPTSKLLPSRAKPTVNTTQKKTRVRGKTNTGNASYTNEIAPASKPPTSNPQTFSGKPRFNKPPPRNPQFRNKTGTDSESDTIESNSTNVSDSDSNSEYTTPANKSLTVRAKPTVSAYKSDNTHGSDSFFTGDDDSDSDSSSSPIQKTKYVTTIRGKTAAKTRSDSTVDPPTKPALRSSGTIAADKPPLSSTTHKSEKKRGNYIIISSGNSPPFQKQLTRESTGVVRKAPKTDIKEQ